MERQLKEREKLSDLFSDFLKGTILEIGRAKGLDLSGKVEIKFDRESDRARYALIETVKEQVTDMYEQTGFTVNGELNPIFSVIEPV